MILKELFEPTPAGYGTDKEDNSVLKLSDLRKTRLTLAQIQKLRLLNDVKKYEYEQKIKDIVQQYSPPTTEQPLGGL